MREELNGVVIDSGSIDMLVPYPDALACLVAMVRYHGSEQAFRLDRRIGLLAMGRKRLNAALGLLVHNDFVRLIEPGTASKLPLFEWPERAVEQVPSSGIGIVAPADCDAGRRNANGGGVLQ
jgi:hypothetical protein